MGAHVALLRGVNVGGKNRLPMQDLVVMLEAAGCHNIRTYIQSGNALFEAADPVARRVPAVVGKALAKRLKNDIPVVVRTAAELARVAKANPFQRAGVNPDALHVGFLADAPGAAAVAKLDPRRSPPDRFLVVGREIYLHCPNGMARTKLTNAWFDAGLKTVSTMRNWRTVLALLAMAQGKEPEPAARKQG